MLQSVLIEFLKDFRMSFHHLLQSSHVIFGGKIYQIFGDEPRLKIPSICLEFTLNLALCVLSGNSNWYSSTLRTEVDTPVRIQRRQSKRQEVRSP